MEFLVTATLLQHLKCYVQADSLEEAQKIADYELITDDFNVTNIEFSLGEVK
jgi:rRNA maturation endonuclease Nob1